MKITYIYNSGFLIESENFDILLDYYKDTKENFIEEEVSKREKPIYILSSHGHFDHFNPEILKLKEKRNNIKYILSSDIKEEIDFSDAIYLEKGEIFTDENLKIKAYGSTDEGISFYIEAMGSKIFHAGDLNNWHWEEEATKEESKEYEDNYLAELIEISKDIKEIDILFFPIDDRLGKDYCRGAVQFLEKIKVELFIPMHFKSKYIKAGAFEKVAKEKGCSFFNIKNKGDSMIWK